ncbi:MAG: TonB-dependent receptor [Duganella sp.]
MSPVAVSAAEAPATNASATRAQPAKNYAIGAAPLAYALNRFAAEAGVVLVFDAGLLGGAQSKGLQGKYDVQGGFQALLAGTQYDAVKNQSGGYVLRVRPVAPAPAPARDGRPVADNPPPTLQPIMVQASSLGTVEKLDKAMIETTAAINGDMTSLLRINPNVQFDDAQLSSLTGGEIAPAEISIHGAKPYQNEILLDGVSISNGIDPGNKITTSSPDLIPGASQSLAVDASILCEIEVLDSNVSAEYGSFVGGVVKSRVCSARKQFGGKVAVGYSSSSWSQLLIDPARQEEFENSYEADLQPRFKKWTYKTTAEARIGADWGVLVSGVRRKSEIPLKRFMTTNENSPISREVTQERKQDTLVVKADYSPATGIHKGEVTLAYAPSDNSYFIPNYRNSDYTIKSGGLNLSGRIDSRFALATVTNQLSYSRNKQSRRGEADYYMNWRWSADKNWGDPTSGINPMSGEGAQGDLDQDIKSVEYKLRAAFAPFKTGPLKHRVNAGLELRMQDATYERLKTQYNYSNVFQLPATGSMSRCEAADGTIDNAACSASPTRQGFGQYFRNLIIYNKGSFDVNAHSSSVYLEDDVSWNSVSLRAGVRADKDSIASKTNIAPRLKLSWQASDVLAFDAGANRYYGRNLFAYALQEKANLLKTTRNRSASSLVWDAEAASLPLNRLDEVRSPHDDELTAGLTYESDLLAGPLSVRYTHRDGKDQVVRLLQTGRPECANNNCYVFSNSGKSETRDITVSWSNARAFKIGSSANRFWVAVNKSDTKSNYSTYATNFSAAMLNDNFIYYDGKVIRYSEIPAANYNRPWTARFGAMTTLPAQRLTVNNMLRVRGSMEQILQRGNVVINGQTMQNWVRTPLPRALALDTVINWTPRVYQRQELDVKLTIENITNRKNMIAVSDAYATYERGRTIALEIGYDF